MATGNNKLKSILRKGAGIFVAVIVVGVIVTLLIFNYTYSEGKRAGVLVKFSKKGYIFKTYEGELNLGGLGNLPGTAQMDQLWHFSVRNEAVAATLMNVEGKKISVHYKQIVKNMVWQGETDYFIDSVQVLDK